MPSVHTTVFGLYASAEAAQDAFDHLLAGGFHRSEISILVPDNETTRLFSQEKPPPGTAASGVSTGGLVGGGLGLLAGLGELAVPGIGPLMAAGPITATLIGAAVGGTLGGLVGALIGIGIPEYEAKMYEEAVKEGGILLSIHCDSADKISAVESALESTGAGQVASTCEEISDESLSSPSVLTPREIHIHNSIAEIAL